MEEFNKFCLDLCKTFYVYTKSLAKIFFLESLSFTVYALILIVFYALYLCKHCRNKLYVQSRVTNTYRIMDVSTVNS